MNCEILDCGYLKDFVFPVPTCRPCMINTIRRLCITEFGTMPSYYEVEEVICERQKNDRITSAFKFFLKHAHGMVAIENSRYEEFGYEEEQYI